MKPIPTSRPSIDDADIASVIAVLRSDALTLGQEVPRFEAAFAARHQVAHAIAVSNATAGLQLACLALGIQAGARVWTTPNSSVAPANAALHCGATVDFVDIDPRSRNLSVAALKDKLIRAERNGSLPQLLIPVHFAGLPCDMAELRKLADRYDFAILEDAAHATGAEYRGAPVGHAFADATVFSFQAGQVITTGEGGMVVTQRSEIAERLRLLRSHGLASDAPALSREGLAEQIVLGTNARMSDIHAALGRSQLVRLPEMQTLRERLAARYDRALAVLPLKLPLSLPDRRSAWHLYAVELNDDPALPSRADIFRALRAAGIGVGVQGLPIHTHPYYRTMGFRRGDFPAAELWHARALSLPLFPGLREAEQDRVIAALAAAIERRAIERVQ